MSQLDKIIKTYRALASIPALIGAKVSKDGSHVTSVWTERNLERGKITKFTQTHMLAPNLKKASETIPVDVTSELLTSISPSERYRAVIREFEDKGVRKYHLEIWSNTNLATAVDLAALEIHGDVYTDAEFGVLEWSPDETKLIYVAEKKEPKTEPFYKRKVLKQDEPKDNEPTKGEQFLFVQDWGEQMVLKKQSVIVQYTFHTDSFKILEGIPEARCPAQPVWSPDGSYIVGVSLRTHPRKLGLVYCTNRPSAIFTLDFNGNYDELSHAGKSVKSPRFTPDGKNLIWLQRDAGGPHHSCVTLVKSKLPLKQDRFSTVIDIVQTEVDIGKHKFYGLYNTNFPKRCWASDKRLLLSTNQKNTINTYVVDVESGKITELEYPHGSQLVLDVYSDIVVVNRRNYFQRDILALAHLPNKGSESSMHFNEISTVERTEFANNCVYTYMDLKHNSNEPVDDFTAIYVGPKSGNEKGVPLVVWPHGGPHSAFANNLAMEAALFNSFGLGILFINYRGSIGAGQANVEYLLGKIGQSDVSDCILATRETLRQFPWLDPKRTVLVGGSHGGFLVTHLSGQYPDMFKAVVARNPVIDVASMSIVSDIPDWCFVECGSSYTQVGPPSEEMLLKMRKASPIQHAHKVKAPTLLQLGSKDLRVPASQGVEYYHRLKANGIHVRMNLYDDNHPLGTVANEMDNLINSLLWIQQHIR